MSTLMRMSKTPGELRSRDKLAGEVKAHAGGGMCCHNIITRSAESAGTDAENIENYQREVRDLVLLEERRRDVLSLRSENLTASVLGVRRGWWER